MERTGDFHVRGRLFSEKGDHSGLHRRDFTSVSYTHLKWEDNLVIEEYVEGREFSIGVIDYKALPIIEIAPIHDLPGRENRLRKALALVQKDYDFIFIDCPPSLDLLKMCIRDRYKGGEFQNHAKGGMH